MQARFVSIEGIDQSGKKTQTRLLASKLRRQGFKTYTLGFPIYTTATGQEIRAFLEGRRHYSPKAVHVLYSLNRWENLAEITRRLKESDFLVADRYAGSNLAYGLARGLDLEWLVGLDKGLPKPDLVVVLDVPVGSSFVRKKGGRDVHESDRGFLFRVRKNYLRLAKRFRWRVVSGVGSAEAVHSEVWRVVQRLAR